MTEDDYSRFLHEIASQDNLLIEVSQKFADLTKVAKQILDETKEKSKQRKEDNGVFEADEAIQKHHRPLPEDLNRKLRDTVYEVGNFNLF